MQDNVLAAIVKDIHIKYGESMKEANTKDFQI